MPPMTLGARRTKIVATVGPACESPEQLEAMVRAGVDVFRLNFSHGTQEEHGRTFRLVRELSAQAGRAIAVLGDLQGPKIRTGALQAEEFQLKSGATFTITTRPVPGDEREVSTTFDRLPEYATPGQRLLLDDGRLELQVVEVQGDDIRCTVVQGGPLRAHKGINLPDTKVAISPLTEKDLDDLAFCLDLGVDYLALSFIQHPDDLLPARQMMRARRVRVPLIAKIEKPAAMEHLDGILRAFDGAMVARGDLGVETSPEQVPVYQKRIIRLANEMGKPVITATQMLESMTHAPRPTRAEASDAANAVWDGTDAVMLSGETAIGEFPIETVETLARIVVEAEGDPSSSRARQASAFPDSRSAAVVHAACDLCGEREVVALVVLTRSGRTAQLASALRPEVPVIALTPDPAVCRRLALWSGVYPYQVPFMKSTDGMVLAAEDFLLAEGLVEPRQMVVIAGSMPLIARARTNFVKLHRIRGV